MGVLREGIGGLPQVVEAVEILEDTVGQEPDGDPGKQQSDCVRFANRSLGDQAAQHSPCRRLGARGDVEYAPTPFGHTHYRP
jgi:hypothetical protein